mmetsp:Transcript_38145/g.119015  ORF Transcript_38145/g.119015 Transcript_38145/m.119015 type:complete len:209 (+) Transcript_38145:175-801(+)
MPFVCGSAAQPSSRLTCATAGGTSGAGGSPNPPPVKNSPSHAGFTLAADELQQRSDGGVRADVQGRDCQAELTERVSHLRGDQRVAAHVEEAVLQIKKLLVQVQRLGPHVAHSLAKTAMRQPLAPGQRPAAGEPGVSRGPAEDLLSRAGVRLQGRHPRACQDDLLRQGDGSGGSVGRAALIGRGSRRHLGARLVVADPPRRDRTVCRP